MHSRYITLLFTLTCVSSVCGQIDLQLDRGTTGLARTLRQLQTTASVIHVVAHPDDEDGPLLTYCSRGLGARTLLFSITRGEGGANLISSQFFDELGALRTLEHLKSASYYGNELFYSRATDYGYSKTLEEARRQWQDGDPILADLVEVVRREQPTIVLSRFRGDPRDGHGHHQMAGVISAKVFAAAADPKQFPEQLQRGLFPWQVKKLYVNDFKWRRAADDNDWTVQIPTGKYDASLGRSYAQLARYGLGFQRSQGISGHWSEAGARTAYYKLTKSADGSYSPDEEDSILDNLDASVTSWIEMTGAADDSNFAKQVRKLKKHIAAAVQNFDGRNPELIVKELSQALAVARQTQAQIPNLNTTEANKYSVQLQNDRKLQQLQTAITQAMGLSLESWIDAEDDVRFAVAGREFDIKTRLVNPSSLPVQIAEIEIDAPTAWEVAKNTVADIVLKNNEHYEGTSSIKIGQEVTVSRPYWRRESIREPFYQVEGHSQQRPTVVASATCRARVKIGQTEVLLNEPVMIRFRDPEMGRVRYPVTTLPKIGIRFTTGHGVIPVGAKTSVLEVETISTVPVESPIRLRLDLPERWKSEPEVHELSIDKANEQRISRFVVTLPDDVDVGENRIKAIANVGEARFEEGFETVTARDLDRLTLFKPATHRLHVVDMKFEGSRNVGYIMGSGDAVPAALTAFGITPRLLTEEDLRAADLSEFDVILVGVRAYAIRPDIRKYNQRLLDYTKAGGTLIVQYQTPEFDKNFGPYPYEMGRPEEVSEENAVVTILEPSHRVFQSPNKITQRDFDGWLEQRGSKFWKTWDKRYTPLLKCHDSGQSPQEGGMLIAEYGEGVYVYSAYAWYRQLPNAVTGAYRIFANMLSL